MPMNPHRPIDDVMHGDEDPESSLIPRADPLWDDYWCSHDMSKCLSLHLLDQGSLYFWIVYKHWHPYLEPPSLNTLASASSSSSSSLPGSSPSRLLSDSGWRAAAEPAPAHEANPIVDCNPGAFLVALGITVPYKFQDSPVLGVPDYIQLIRNDVIVNPPDVPRHIPAPLREADDFLYPTSPPSLDSMVRPAAHH